ncbi:MAG TPA: hypothetical protein DCQ31_17105 [Bacteroidales bacterium]|nr:hypothetical protein [Bacteroidales bacterium]
MKYIVSAILWAYGLTVFAILILLSIGGMYVLPEKQGHALVRFFMRWFFRLILIPVKIEGKENYHKTESYIIMPNHVSFFDAPLVQNLPMRLKGIEDESHFRWPVYGLLLKKYGNIPIDRTSVRSSLRSLESAFKMATDGMSVLVFPEGTRTRTGKLVEFKKLPFRFVKENNLPILPVGFSGLYTLNPKSGFIISPTSLKIKIGEAISSEFIQNHSIEEIMELTRQRIEGLIEKP